MTRSVYLHSLAWLAAAAALVVLALACDGGSSRNPTTPPPPGPPPTTGQVIDVAVQDNAFSPRSVTIRAGDSVRWTFDGSVPGHTVTAEDGSFDSGFVFVQRGDTYQRTFGAELDGRTIQYRCTSHQGCCQMQGSVRVGAGAPDPDPGY